MPAFFAARATSFSRATWESLTLSETCIFAIAGISFLPPYIARRSGRRAALRGLDQAAADVARRQCEAPRRLRQHAHQRAPAQARVRLGPERRDAGHMRRRHAGAVDAAI